MAPSIRWLMAPAVASMLLALAGCSGSATVEGPADVRVTVSPDTVQLAMGQTQQFTAAVSGSDDPAVLWAVEEVGGGSIDATGLYTSPATAGTYHVLAASRAHPSARASAQVIVTSSEPLPVAVTVSPRTATLAAGATQQFAAAVTGASNTAVTWSVEESAGGSITAGGLYTAPATAGTYHVVATSQADSAKSDRATVTVPGPQEVAVTISPTAATLLTEATQRFVATVTGSSDTTVDWSVEEAGGGAIDSSGLYTAPSRAGDYHVVATSRADTAKSARATVTVSATPEFGFTIRAEHPRLWWSAARLAEARAWLAAHPFTPSATDYFHIAWKHAVDGTDCTAAVAWAASRQVAYGQWQPTANGSDEARWYGGDASLVYDWCFDQWSAQQRADFLNNIGGSGYGWNDYLTGINQQSWGGPEMVQSNYNLGNLRNDLQFGIATWSENPLAPTLLADGITRRWQSHFVPSVPVCQAGGVGQEGTAYGSAMAPPPIPFVTVADGGRDLLNETGFYKQLVYWVLYSTTPAPTYNTGAGQTAFQLVPFSDDEIFVDGGVLNQRPYYQDWMTFAANYWSAIDAGKHARQWVDTVTADAATLERSRFVMAHDGTTAAAAYSTLPLDYYASSIQYLYGRKAWDTSSTYFSWQLGGPLPCSGVGHTHVDVGTFNLWRGGRWLARESTGYSDTITGYGYRGTPSDLSDSMVAHNGLLFGTPLSDWGPLLPTIPSAQAAVRRLESRPGYTYADVDLTNRYHWDTGHLHLEVGAAVHVERELLFLRDLETTVILDRLTAGDVTAGQDLGTAAADVVNTFLIHFETSPTLEDATHLTATNGSQALRMTTLVPSNPVRRVIDEQSCAGCSARIGQHRVELDTSGTAQRYFLHVLQARAATGSDLAASVMDSNPVDPAAGTFTVTLHPSAGSDTVIVFNKGQTGTGGSVDLAGAGAAALTSGVQSISYTDSGPLWGP